MSTTLRADSLSPTNIIDRTDLASAVSADSLTITVINPDGITANTPLIIGTPGLDDAELRLVASVLGNVVTLTVALALDHPLSSSVTALRGNSVNFYRAPNVTGSAPSDDAYTLLITRSLDVDNQSTYYVDATGSNAYWYKYTYYNAVTLVETDLTDSTGFRGDDFGHYASLTEIRKDAGFMNAPNLSDSDIELQRKIAEAEVNTALGGHYTTPFVAPIPGIVNAITIKLASAYLLRNAYGTASPAAREKLVEAGGLLDSAKSGAGEMDGSALGERTASFYGYPNTGDRMFTVDMEF